MITRERKMRKRMMSIILMLSFLIALAIPNTTAQAATNYNKVNKTYKIGNLGEILKYEYTGSSEQLEKGYTNVYKFSTDGGHPVYFTFLSSENSDYDVCLMKKTGKNI